MILKHDTPMEQRVRYREVYNAMLLMSKQDRMERGAKHTKHAERHAQKDDDDQQLQEEDDRNERRRWVEVVDEPKAKPRNGKEKNDFQDDSENCWHCVTS